MGYDEGVLRAILRRGPLYPVEWSAKKRKWGPPSPGFGWRNRTGEQDADEVAEAAKERFLSWSPRDFGMQGLDCDRGRKDFEKLLEAFPPRLRYLSQSGNDHAAWSLFGEGSDKAWRWKSAGGEQRAKGILIFPPGEERKLMKGIESSGVFRFPMKIVVPQKLVPVSSREFMGIDFLDSVAEENTAGRNSFLYLNGMSWAKKNPDGDVGTWLAAKNAMMEGIHPNSNEPWPLDDEEEIESIANSIRTFRRSKGNGPFDFDARSKGGFVRSSSYAAKRREARNALRRFLFEKEGKYRRGEVSAKIREVSERTEYGERSVWTMWREIS